MFQSFTEKSPLSSQFVIEISELSEKSVIRTNVSVFSNLNKSRI